MIENHNKSLTKILFTKNYKKTDVLVKVDIDVNGLVCEFCAVTIEKGFEKKPEIQEVKVDLEVGKVFITFTDGNNLTDEELTDVIINNGYNVAKINRNLNE